MNHEDTEKQRVLRQFIACQERMNEMEKRQNQQQSVLVEARDLFESLFELSPDALIVVDPQAHITRVNTQAEKLFGYTRDEMIGKDHGMLVPERFREKHEAGLKAYMNQPHSGQPHVRAMGLGSALWGRSKDGSEFPAEIDMGPLQRGAELSVLTVVRDVTRRKQLETELLESEERYRRLFTTMSSGYAYCQIITDQKNQPVDFIYLEVNESFERLIGLKKADVIGKRVTEGIPGIAGLNPEIIPVYGKVALTGEPASFEVFFKPREIWFTVTVYSPKRGYFVAVFDDISQRKKLEEELDRYRQRLEATVAERTTQFTRAYEKLTLEINEREKANEGLQLRAAILDNAREAIFLVNPKGNFAYANEAAIKTYGYSLDEFLNMKLQQLLRPEDAPVIESRLREVLQKGQLELEVTHVRKDGSLMPVRVRHSAIKTSHGDFVVSVMDDITRESVLRKLLEKSKTV